MLFFFNMYVHWNILRVSRWYFMFLKQVWIAHLTVRQMWKLKDVVEHLTQMFERKGSLKIVLGWCHEVWGSQKLLESSQLLQGGGRIGMGGRQNSRGLGNWVNEFDQALKPVMLCVSCEGTCRFESCLSSLLRCPESWLYRKAAPDCEMTLCIPGLVVSGRMWLVKKFTLGVGKVLIKLKVDHWLAG